jgi:DHA1 family bicyclomycin/chloramphenicol resistance-like MFS transporter
VALSRVYGRVLVHGRFLSLVMAFSAWFGGMFLYIAGAPSLIFDHLKLDAESFGVQFVPMVAGVMLGAFTSGRLAHRWQAERTVRVALAVMLAAATCNLVQAEWLAPAPWNVIAPLAVYAFGSALAMPNVTVLALDCFPHNRGLASAVQGFVQVIFNSAVAGIAVPFFSRSVPGFAAGQTLFITIAVLFWAAADRRDGRRAGA